MLEKTVLQARQITQNIQPSFPLFKLFGKYFIKTEKDFCFLLTYFTIHAILKKSNQWEGFDKTWIHHERGWGVYGRFLKRWGNVSGKSYTEKPVGTHIRQICLSDWLLSCFLERKRTVSILRQMFVMFWYYGSSGKLLQFPQRLHQYIELCRLH